LPTIGSIKTYYNYNKNSLLLFNISPKGI
jgi:hypothetical protein